MIPVRKRVVYHIIFWILYFTFNTIRWGSYFDDYVYSFKSNLVEFPIHLVSVYFNIFYLLPRYIPGRPLKYICYLILAVLALSLMRIVLTYEFVTTEVWRESTIHEDSLFGLNYIVAVFIGEIYVVGFTTSIKLIIDWVRAKKRTRELQKQNQETELSFLRSQVQPHFFFNTLNNLYSLTLDKSDKAPEMILKLSDLMSYVVYKGKGKSVSLLEEVKHIHNYIDLERLRYGDKLEVEFSISGQIQDKHLPPLILMPFVENSFKHGMQYKNGKIPIEIDLTVTGNSLYFKTLNSKAVPSPSGFLNKKGSGIGIQNTRRRLELLYGNNYFLKVEDKAKLFILSLKISLDEA